MSAQETLHGKRGALQESIHTTEMLLAGLRADLKDLNACDYDPCELESDWVVGPSPCHPNAEDNVTCYDHIGMFVHQGSMCTHSVVSRLR